ncbi:putative sensor domain DACNV-containing protein [Mucilaginibacter panaciglaebae]|uniref:Probable sensor domain-containing protein n=1 Tax=Mucilaginibacter panaciglaebae TaxID=502331 RepID=A0ABP7WXG7_9SPHI
MLSEPTYLPARMVAASLEGHFARHLENARQRGTDNLAHEPQSAIIESVIDVAFWASLRKEEGHPPKISIAILKPEQASHPLVFGNRIRLTPHNLTKLAPAVESPGIHLGVWYDDDELYVWGTTLTIPGICFVLEVVEPGLLVIKHSRTDGFGKFLNIAVLKGDDIKIIDEQNTGMQDCPALLDSLPGMASPFVNGSINLMVELATSMRKHGRGGLVLIVPENSERWRESIVQPMSYPVIPAFKGITKLMLQDHCERQKADWRDALVRAIDIVGGFTAVDGATVMTRNYELLAFGAKIARSGMSSPVDQIVTTEPVLGGTPVKMHPSQNGGTRHLAAAQFVFDQRNAIALVASQDGRFTIFAWSEAVQMVHAHRIDILLL